MTLFGLLGAQALYLTYIWLASAILGAYLSDRKGYGEKPGLASGLLLSAFGAIVWLIIPARPESNWKRFGPVGKTKGARRDEPPVEKATPTEA